MAAPAEVQTWIAQEQATLIPKEIWALGSNICIFVTGPNYDDILSKAFKGLKFEAIDGNSVREIARVIHPDLPHSSFRTYHPNYLIRSNHWHLLERIIDKAASENPL